MATVSPTIEKIPWDLINPVEIGKGGFGVVYRVTANKELGHPVYAVKKISVDLFKYYYYRHNDGCVNGWTIKILREVEALKNLTNDHVVKYYRCQFEGENADVYNNGDISQVNSESDFTSGQKVKRLTFFYIQMEYCNSDLRKWLTQRKSLETRKIREIHEIFLQILTALQYIHEKQITHRDLKPENIFIVETTDSMRIKIGDFGLATCNLNDLNEKGEVGTEIYRSPEMNSKNDTRDFKTDIYSLGLTFLECIDPDLNDRMKREMVFTKILLRNYSFPEFIRTGFSYEMRLIRNMTKTNKEERFGAKQALQYLKENVIRSINGYLCTSSNMQIFSGPSSSQIDQPGVLLKGQCKNPIKQVPAWNLGNSELECNSGPSQSLKVNSRSNGGEECSPAKIFKLADGFGENRTGQPSPEFMGRFREIKWPISHGLKKTAKNLCGRKKELEELNSYFNSYEDLVVHCGFGGIGKTELCRKFANETPEETFGNISSISYNVPIPQDVFSRGLPGHETVWPITFGLKKPAKNFSGRDEELDKLTLNFFGEKEDLVLVCGIGGIGKTELCKKFAGLIHSNEKKSSRLTSRVWIHGDTRQTLRNSVLKLARELGIPEKAGEDIHTSVYFEEAVSKILRNSDDLLVIIDNVDFTYEEVLKVINTVQKSRSKGRMFVIVTSRNCMVLDAAGITIQLNALLPKQAKEMLHSSIEHINDLDANTLCHLVECLPLALQQAVSYIKRQNAILKYNVSDFVDEFHFKKEKMFGKRLNEIQHCDYSETTLIVWDMTISKLSEGSVEILKILGYLDADNIELGFLQTLFSKYGRDFEDLKSLLQYSLVNEENEIVNIHRLVQDVMRRKVKDEEFCKILFDKLLLSCGKSKKISAGPTRSELVHLNSVVRFAWGHQIRYILYYYEVLLFLLDQDRVEFALQCIQEHFPHIRFNNLEERTREWVDKVILWGILNDDFYESATNEAIETGQYDSLQYISSSLLAEALQISTKYFGGNKIIFEIKHELVQKLYTEDFDKALSLCAELASFSFDDEQRKIFFKTIDKFLKHAEKIVNEKMYFVAFDSKTISCFEGIYKIVVHFNEYRTTITELKILLWDFSNITKEEIECEFIFKGLINADTDSDVDELHYSEKIVRFGIWGKILRILPIYEWILGEKHALTLKLKMKMEDHTSDYAKFYKHVLKSSFDLEYKKAFNCICRCNPYCDNNYKLQVINMLEELLKEKIVQLGLNHSNSIRIAELLANTFELWGKFEKALEKFNMVYSSDCGRDEIFLENIRLDIIRVRLILGDFSDLNTRDDVYNAFGGFHMYSVLSKYQLEKVLTFYENILGPNDQLTLIVKNAMATCLWRNHSKSIDLIEQVIQNCSDANEIELAYDTMSIIAKNMVNEFSNYKKSNPLFERVLKFQIASLGENHVETIQTKFFVRLGDLTKEEIETQFSTINYDVLSWRELERIEPHYDQILSQDHLLTVKVKMLIVRIMRDKEKCARFCEQILNSPYDSEYADAFYGLRRAKNIVSNVEQKNILKKLLTVKQESLGEVHRNTVTIFKMWGKTIGKCEEDLKLLEQFRISQVKAAKAKLEAGDFSMINTRHDIYREFEEFHDYDKMSLQQLQKIFAFYTSILDKYDPLICEVKNAM